MKEKDIWAERWKEKLADYNEPVPPLGWEQLEKELIPIVEKRIVPFRKWMAVAATLLLLVGTSLSFYFLGTPAADTIRQTTHPALAVTSGTASPTNTPTQSADQLTDTRIVPNAVPVSRSKQLVKLTKEIISQEEEEEKQLPVYPDQPSSEKTTETKTVQTKARHKPSSKDKYHLPIQSHSKKSKGWSIGASVGNTGLLANNEATNMDRNVFRLDMAAAVDGVIQIPGDKTVIFQEGIPYLQGAADIVSIDHHQPISFGLSVRKTLPKGFSIETGLTYTLLSSDVKMGNNSEIKDQRLHYMGIPVRANWNFYSKKLLTLYASAGGSVEKCVYAELADSKTSVKPLQFSVMAAVGAQINATKYLGLYVEPGIAHFFDDGSPVQTIRKENPLNFHIQAGVRFSY